ncbi:uncharacterized protein LOC133518178 [Cydia pomonella]|uniref:uncharacterized protein LOC133518178 n=1 Tax=Cydia pomonella TaxID=82600 RepID=UPI002ADE2930|nr:uncharacterized protein LOC133518178 [Cydia pomonella]
MLEMHSICRGIKDERFFTFLLNCEMFLQGRVIIVWLSWLIGGICGVVILLAIVCYCRLMPRHQKSFDEQYLKEKGSIKDSYAAYTSQDGYTRVKNAEVQVSRHLRPASYAGDAERRGRASRAPPPPEPPASRDQAAQYASSGMLDELSTSTSIDALKTRSLPAFLRPKPRPLSTEDDLQQLYAKVSLSKKYKNRMRSEHAAIIALSKSRSQFFDADAVIVYDQRTAL